MKLFFSELPEPLIPFRFYERIIAVGDDADRVVSLAQAELPTTNLELLYFLTCLLADVCKRSNLNKMTARSLGIIFGPTLLRQRQGELSTDRLVSDTTICSKICETFINKSSNLKPAEDRRTGAISLISFVICLLHVAKKFL